MQNVVQNKPFKLKPPAKKKTTEAVTMKAIRDVLRYKGWFVVRNQQGMGSHAGLSDLVAIKNSIVIWIEVKAEKGYMSPHQEQFKQDISTHGGLYILAKTVDDVVQYIDSIYYVVPALNGEASTLCKPCHGMRTEIISSKIK